MKRSRSLSLVQDRVEISYLSSSTRYRRQDVLQPLIRSLGYGYSISAVKPTEFKQGDGLIIKPSTDDVSYAKLEKGPPRPSLSLYHHLEFLHNLRHTVMTTIGVLLIAVELLVIHRLYSLTSMVIFVYGLRVLYLSFAIVCQCSFPTSRRLQFELHPISHPTSPPLTLLPMLLSLRWETNY